MESMITKFPLSLLNKISVQPKFRNGVTNGASWYPITGGMKDFSYQYTGTMEVVVEVSDCKYPHRSKVTFCYVQLLRVI